MQSETINPSLYIKKIDTEVFILNKQAAEIVSFNETGTFIWEMISAQKSRKEIIDSLSKEFDVPQKQATEDLDEFINGLANHKLIAATHTESYKK